LFAWPLRVCCPGMHADLVCMGRLWVSGTKERLRAGRA